MAMLYSSNEMRTNYEKFIKIMDSIAPQKDKWGWYFENGISVRIFPNNIQFSDNAKSRSIGIYDISPELLSSTMVNINETSDKEFLLSLKQTIESHDLSFWEYDKSSYPKEKGRIQGTNLTIEGSSLLQTMDNNYRFIKDVQDAFIQESIKYGNIEQIHLDSGVTMEPKSWGIKLSLDGETFYIKHTDNATTEDLAHIIMTENPSDLNGLKKINERLIEAGYANGEEKSIGSPGIGIKITKGFADKKFDIVTFTVSNSDGEEFVIGCKHHLENQQELLKLIEKESESFLSSQEPKPFSNLKDNINEKRNPALILEGLSDFESDFSIEKGHTFNGVSRGYNESLSISTDDTSKEFIISLNHHGSQTQIDKVDANQARNIIKAYEAKDFDKVEEIMQETALVNKSTFYQKAFLNLGSNSTVEINADFEKGYKIKTTSQEPSIDKKDETAIGYFDDLPFTVECKDSQMLKEKIASFKKESLKDELIHMCANGDVTIFHVNSINNLYIESSQNGISIDLNPITCADGITTEQLLDAAISSAAIKSLAGETFSFEEFKKECIEKGLAKDDTQEQDTKTGKNPEKTPEELEQ